MQPYAFPYGGYFRLLSETDLFIVLDDVQMIRRGYVHRNRLPDANGKLQWLTLPLAYAPQETLIRDIRFAGDSLERWNAQLSRFPLVKNLTPEVWSALWFAHPDRLFVDYAVSLLAACCNDMEIQTPLARASDYNLPREIHGQDRILALCGLTGATTYVNSPGGRALYDPADFAAAGVNLEFLPPWTGSNESVLSALATS